MEEWGWLALAAGISCAALAFWIGKLKKTIRSQEAEMQALRKLSEYDRLSGLKNRNAFLRCAAQEGRSAVTVLACDIDGLKLVNDTLGHWAGDRLIRRTAAVLREVCPDEAQAFRIGGDEFLLLLPQSVPAEQEQLLLQGVLEGVQRHNERYGEIPLSLSVGVASQVAGGGSLEEAVRRADYYMYEQKREGHEKVLCWLQGELEQKASFETRQIREPESREGTQE